VADDFLHACGVVRMWARMQASSSFFCLMIKIFLKVFSCIFKDTRPSFFCTKKQGNTVTM